MKENKRQRQLSRDLDDEEISQYLEDERIAILLQNKEFVQELRRNKHFMQTLELDQTKAQAGYALIFCYDVILYDNEIKLLR